MWIYNIVVVINSSERDMTIPQFTYMSKILYIQYIFIFDLYSQKGDR